MIIKNLYFTGSRTLKVGSWSFLSWVPKLELGNQICNYQIWEEGNHPQMIESEELMRKKLDYIHQNPVKRGCVDLAEHWRYSNAWDFAGMEGLIDITRVW